MNPPINNPNWWSLGIAQFGRATDCKVYYTQASAGWWFESAY